MGRVWFYKPQWYFSTLWPFYRGSDEYGRLTVVLGWAVTGRVVFAYRTCHCAECAESRLGMTE